MLFFQFIDINWFASVTVLDRQVCSFPVYPLHDGDSSGQTCLLTWVVTAPGGWNSPRHSPFPIFYITNNNTYTGCLGLLIAQAGFIMNILSQYVLGCHSRPTSHYVPRRWFFGKNQVYWKPYHWGIPSWSSLCRISWAIN